MTETKLSPKFKEELSDFLKVGLKSCSDFIRDIDSCDTYNELRTALRNNVDELASHLGHDCDDDLEDENQRLKRKVDSLEIELSKLEDKLTPTCTLWDEEKLQSFITYRDKYTPWELEELLRTGK
jgi:predicted nuclease with TOPRIM domain